MTERNPALWMQNRTDHTAEQERSLITGLYLGKEGVMGQDDLKVVQRAAGVNMSVDVGAGRATIFGDDNANQGCYAVWNDGAKNVTLAASHATNGRKDLIVARIKDAFYSGASNTFTLEVITGTPAGAADGSGASDPAVPANCLVLARVTVIATATSIADAKITDLRNRVGTMAASDIICTSTTRPTSPFQGMRIYETDTHKALVYAGATSGWNPPWNLPWGIMGQATVTAEQTVGTGGVDITGASVTYTAVAGRRIRISGKAMMSTGTLASAWTLRVYKDGSIFDVIAVDNDVVANASYGASGDTIDAPSAGSHTYKLNANFTVNTNNKVALSGAGFATVIIVEDIGPAANPT